ncbi:MAG: hypothetical protein Q7T73_17090 [Beijerinckiaceae bacterium]|nr:hypothetical protein [Beijerinckiaceae bacterium]
MAVGDQAANDEDNGGPITRRDFLIGLGGLGSGALLTFLADKYEDDNRAEDDEDQRRAAARLLLTSTQRLHTATTDALDGDEIGPTTKANLRLKVPESAMNTLHKDLEYLDIKSISYLELTYEQVRSLLRKDVTPVDTDLRQRLEVLKEAAVAVIALLQKHVDNGIT